MFLQQLNIFVLKRLYFMVFFLLLCCNNRQEETSNETGQELFVAHCGNCHMLGGTDNYIMNPSQIKRYYSEAFLQGFLRYPDSTIKFNAMAKEMCEKFGKTTHPSFSNKLTDRQIQRLADYLAEYAKNGKD